MILKCKTCDKSFSNTKLYHSHYEKHFGSNNWVVPCPFENCNMTFTKHGYSYLRKHIKKIHNDLDSDFEHRNSLLQSCLAQKKHGKCPYIGCKAIVTSVSSYKMHKHRFHNQKTGNNSNKSKDQDQDMNIDESLDANDPEIMEGDNPGLNIVEDSEIMEGDNRGLNIVEDSETIPREDPDTNCGSNDDDDYDEEQIEDLDQEEIDLMEELFNDENDDEINSGDGNLANSPSFSNFSELLNELNCQYSASQMCLDRLVAGLRDFNNESMNNVIDGLLALDWSNSSGPGFQEIKDVILNRHLLHQVMKSGVFRSTSSRGVYEKRNKIYEDPEIIKLGPNDFFVYNSPKKLLEELFSDPSVYEQYIHPERVPYHKHSWPHYYSDVFKSRRFKKIIDKIPRSERKYRPILIQIYSDGFPRTFTICVVSSKKEIIAYY